MRIAACQTLGKRGLRDHNETGSVGLDQEGLFVQGPGCDGENDCSLALRNDANEKSVVVVAAAAAAVVVDAAATFHRMIPSYYPYESGAVDAGVADPRNDLPEAAVLAFAPCKALLSA